VRFAVSASRGNLMDEMMRYERTLQNDVTSEILEILEVCLL
jgi:hypothetical protein